MGKIKVHEFVSLDGVFESPSWTMPFGFDPAMGETLAALTGPGTSDILLGRTTYEMFAPAWSGRTADDDPGAPFFNETPKHVVTSSPLGVAWSGSSVLGTYSPAVVQDLKTRTTGDVYVSGSGRLVRAMLADGLVDELHLFVYPTVLGAGATLFADGSVTLSLLAHDVYANGVVHLSYGPGTPAL